MRLNRSRGHNERLLVLTIVLLMLLVGVLLLTAISCRGSIDRKIAPDKAQEYIRENFPGLTLVDLDNEAI